MIEIVGVEGSHEHRVALAVRDCLVAQWPGILDSPSTDELVRIAPNAKLSGYPVSDIDLVIGAVFNRPRYFVIRKPIKDREGKNVVGVKAKVNNYLAVLEVKGQEWSKVSISGDEVNVSYKEGWKSATDQNVKQVHALSRYFQDQHLDPWVYRCLVLDGIDALPSVAGVAQPRAGAVVHGFTAGDLLAAMVGVNGISSARGEFYVSSGDRDMLRKALDAPVFQAIVPSRLDRQRMDRISSRRPEAVRLAELLGSKRVHVRGHGGTGKTVLLLQAAHEAYQRHGKRCIVLTYNVALAGDTTRLLALLGVPSTSDGGGIEVRTAMSFVAAWLKQLGTLAPDSSLATYQRDCQECVELLQAGAVSRADIETVLASDPDAFDFDAILVDEAQDWPQSEADLLSIIYGGSKIALADGPGQLLRGRATNWNKLLDRDVAREDRSLTRCLRMKRNLGIFANSVAQLAGLNWEVEPNDEAGGGRVIIISGSYADRPELVGQLVDEARAAKNEPIDFLHCVPPSDVSTTGERRHSRLSRALSGLGYETWDGVDEAVRRDFPRSLRQLRIVQYESSRGLEGWTTVLERVDEAWSQKYEQGLASAEASGATADPERSAALAAWRWTMIALTRSMDTLVLVLADKNSLASGVFAEAARSHPDFVEFRT